MANAPDILRATFIHTFLNQRVVNVFYWRLFTNANPIQIPLTSMLEPLATEYVDKILDKFSNKLALRELKIDNLSDGLEFAESGSSATGIGVDEVLPPFNAMTVSLQRATKLTRNGSKRFAGLTENQVIDGILDIPANVVTDIQGFCGLDIPLVADDGNAQPFILEPVIVGRTKNIQGVYELDLNKVNDITGATIKSEVSTQLSRKFGNGV